LCLSLHPYSCFTGLIRQYCPVTQLLKTGCPGSIFCFCGEGHCSRSYGRAAALRFIVQPCDDSFFIFPSHGAPVE
jgi:hypothetical protein